MKSLYLINADPRCVISLLLMLQVHVQVNDRVEKGQLMMTVEGMKMEVRTCCCADLLPMSPFECFCV